MDEVVGTTLKGNQFNGSAYVAGLPIVPGVTPRTHGAVMFDGKTNKVQFANTMSMCIVNLENCPNGITIAAWLKPGTKPDTQYCTYVCDLLTSKSISLLSR